MARTSRRRSRDSDEDEDSNSRPATPNSTAPDDGKRARRNYDVESDGSRLFGVSKTRRAHQPGAIVRVKLTNFVTYTSAEFHPGPNLNMVIGPNGTGKSTLVCAICLGLGWGTQYLGRAKDAAEFVKHGCREAIIEIELQRATSGRHSSSVNPIITRTIKREGNKSTYTLNGNSTSGKAIMSLAQSFNIQIDNLCQFLPQDKVVEFAQMTPIQILESTQRAAAPSEILQFHQDLIAIRKQQREHGNGNRGDRENLAQMENRQAGQETEVNRLKERAKVQRQLDLLQQCRQVAQYSDAKSQHKEAKARQKEVGDELKRLREEAGPTLEKVNAKEEYVKDAQAAKSDIEKEFKRIEKECVNFDKELAVLDATTADCDNIEQAEQKSIQPTKQDIMRDKQKIVMLQKQKERPPEDLDFTTINQQIQEKTTLKRSLEGRITELQAEATAIKEHNAPRQAEAKALKAQLDKFGTQVGQQETKLEDASRDTYRAWKWIQEHRDQFSKHVFGPPIVECSLTEPQRANQIESLLQNNDFKIITAQCKEDFYILQRELVTKQRIPGLSLRVCTLDSLESFRPPLNASQMQEFGIGGWALDYLQGPATVVAMLCQERMLHQTAVAVRDISDEKFKALPTVGVRSYVDSHNSHRFVKRAEYGAAGEMSTSQALKKPNFWTGQSSGQGRKAEIQAKLNELTDDLREVRDGLKALGAEAAQKTEEISNLAEEIEELRQNKDARQKQMVEYNGLDTKIHQLEEKIAKSEGTLDSMRDRLAENQAKRDEAMLAKPAVLVKYGEAIHELKAEQEKLVEIEVMLIEAQNDVDTLTFRNKRIVDLKKQAEVEEQEARKTSKKFYEQAMKLQQAVVNLQRHAEELGANGDDDLEILLNQLTQGREKDLTERELDDMIDIEKAKLELTEGGDANIIREYEERQRKIERLRERVNQFASQQKEYMDGIHEIRSKWEPEVDRLVANISDAFGDSFARIGCAGQVAVYKASSEDAIDCTEETGGSENGLDFENWAIHISVKFRENEALSLLDSHRQSGGERAVSTIFYLMAMQSLSRAPFRVVDEINQGMDPRNERMVHGRMVDIAAADEDGNGQGSQYFLITPKLLSGLKYRPGMTVLCIVSGENMPNPSDSRKKGEDGKWYVEHGRPIDFAVFARRARNLGLSRSESAGRRVDSGVSVSMDGRTSFGTTIGGSQVSQVTQVGA